MEGQANISTRERTETQSEDIVLPDALEEEEEQETLAGQESDRTGVTE